MLRKLNNNAMITRNVTIRDLNAVFFPVDEEPISLYIPNQKSASIPGYKAIMDVERRKVLSVVSNKYRLVLNREAYDIADYLVHAVFGNKSIHDFECFNIHMPITRGSCRVDLIIRNNFNKLFCDDKESWTPFLRISNSYNKTTTLKYDIGFCRWICLNGVIFGQIGISISLTHDDRISRRTIDKVINKAQSQIGDINAQWNIFEQKMSYLKNIELPSSSTLAMFCKVFGIVVNPGNITNAQKENMAKRAKQIVQSSKVYFKELGNNAYAMMNVMTDYASFPEWTNNSALYVDGYQKRVGKWVDNIIAEHEKGHFNLSQYIGEEYINTAFFLKTLVSGE